MARVEEVTAAETSEGESGSNAAAIQELVPFLANPRPEVRKAGVDIVFQLTGSEEGVRELKKTEAPRFLCRMVGDMKKIAEPALKALINLSADVEIVSKLLGYGVIDSVINFLSEDESENKRLVLMLLANLTVSEAGALKLLEVDKGQLQGLQVRRLVRWFLTNQPEPKAFQGRERTEEKLGELDPWQYVANILANITQVQEGRDLIRRKSTNIVRDIIPELNSINPVRRRGVAATLKNVCFVQDDHWHYYAELDLIPHLLYPLAGPESLDEEDATVRRLLVEILLLFCTTRAGRKDLRKQKVYPIIRNAHLVETDEEVSEEMYKVVDFLIRDEEGEAPDLDKLQREAEKAQEMREEETERDIAQLSLQDKDEGKREDEEEEDDDDDLPDLLPSSARRQGSSAPAPPPRQQPVQVDELD